MSSKHRYLLNRDGRYFARIVIPKPLRPFLENKSELRELLGPDRRTVIARLATAISAESEHAPFGWRWNTKPRIVRQMLPLSIIRANLRGLSAIEHMGQQSFRSH